VQACFQFPWLRALTCVKDLNSFLQVLSCDTQWASRWTKNVTISENIMLTGDVSIMLFWNTHLTSEEKLAAARHPPTTLQNFKEVFTCVMYMCYETPFTGLQASPALGQFTKWIAFPQGHYERLESLQHLLLEMSRLKRLCIHAGDRDSRLAWIGNLLLISSSSINAN